MPTWRKGLPPNLTEYKPIRITDDSLQSYGFGNIKSYFGGPEWFDIGTNKSYLITQVEWLDEQGQPKEEEEIEWELFFEMWSEVYHNNPITSKDEAIKVMQKYFTIHRKTDKK